MAFHLGSSQTSFVQGRVLVRAEYERRYNQLVRHEFRFVRIPVAGLAKINFSFAGISRQV